MRRFITIAFAVLFTASAALAQNIRLGERIPAIDIDATMGTHLDHIETEYVCLVFIHSSSLPCIEALEEFVVVADEVKQQMSVVLITPERHDDEKELLARFVDDNTSVAFDRDYKTFNAFGINFAPFGVIYDTKRCRAQWFGSIQQLDTATLWQITQQRQIKK